MSKNLKNKILVGVLSVCVCICGIYIVNQAFTNNALEETNLEYSERIEALNEDLLEAKEGLEEVSQDYNELTNEVAKIALEEDAIFYVDVEGGSRTIEFSKKGLFNNYEMEVYSSVK